MVSIFIYTARFGLRGKKLETHMVSVKNPGKWLEDLYRDGFFVSSEDVKVSLGYITKITMHLL